MILESIFTFAIRLRVITAAFYNGNENQLKLCDDFAAGMRKRKLEAEAVEAVFFCGSGSAKKSTASAST